MHNSVLQVIFFKQKFELLTTFWGNKLQIFSLASKKNYLYRCHQMLKVTQPHYFLFTFFGCPKSIYKLAYFSVVITFSYIVRVPKKRASIKSWERFNLRVCSKVCLLLLKVNPNRYLRAAVPRDLQVPFRQCH